MSETTTARTPAGEHGDALPWVEVLSHERLAARAADVRAAIAASSGTPLEDVDPKVAMSALQVGLASRLWSVTMAGAVLPLAVARRNRRRLPNWAAWRFWGRNFRMFWTWPCASCRSI